MGALVLPLEDLFDLAGEWHQQPATNTRKPVWKLLHKPFNLATMVGQAKGDRGPAIAMAFFHGPLVLPVLCPTGMEDDRRIVWATYRHLVTAPPLAHLGGRLLIPFLPNPERLRETGR